MKYFSKLKNRYDTMFNFKELNELQQALYFTSLLEDVKCIVKIP